MCFITIIYTREYAYEFQRNLHLVSFILIRYGIRLQSGNASLQYYSLGASNVPYLVSVLDSCLLYCTIFLLFISIFLQINCLILDYHLFYLYSYVLIFTCITAQIYEYLLVLYSII